ncbi:MAG: hypothetical protein AAF985_21530 [Bacteroidota bacterium]
MEKILQENIDIQGLLKPESDLERLILQNEDFIQGLLWGKPRFGHPEGKVLYHVREVLDNVDKLTISTEERSQLRLISLVHDSFKHREDKTTQPRDWSKHHGVLARKFMEPLINDQEILTIIELHDEAYYCWRLKHIYRDVDAADQRLNYLLEKIGAARQLYYLFFKCDTRTGDKNQAPLHWFEKNIPEIKIVDF